jgi:hypothetical protein
VRTIRSHASSRSPAHDAREILTRAGFGPPMPDPFWATRRRCRASAWFTYPRCGQPCFAPSDAAAPIPESWHWVRTRARGRTRSAPGSWSRGSTDTASMVAWQAAVGAVPIVDSSPMTSRGQRAGPRHRHLPRATAFDSRRVGQAEITSINRLVGGYGPGPHRCKGPPCRRGSWPHRTPHRTPCTSSATSTHSCSR